MRTLNIINLKVNDLERKINSFKNNEQQSNEHELEEINEITQKLPIQNRDVLAEIKEYLSNDERKKMLVSDL